MRRKREDGFVAEEGLGMCHRNTHAQESVGTAVFKMRAVHPSSSYKELTLPL